jgi:hypothetical protein
MVAVKNIVYTGIAILIAAFAMRKIWPHNVNQLTGRTII